LIVQPDPDIAQFVIIVIACTICQVFYCVFA